MSYYLSTDPIPQNSLMPPPAAEGQAADARRLAIFMDSRTGRERVYANLPTAQDLGQISLPLAVNAQGMISASEVARQTVLNGVGEQDSGGVVSIAEDIASLIANAPQVLSLNGSSAIAPAQANTGAASPGNTTVYPTMPVRAPNPGVGGGYWNPRPAKGPQRSTPVNVKQKQAAPPGCGLSGFSPAWGDAYAGYPQSQPGQAQGNGGWWLVAGLAGLGLYAMSQKKKGRR